MLQRVLIISVPIMIATFHYMIIQVLIHYENLIKKNITYTFQDPGKKLLRKPNCAGFIPRSLTVEN